MSDLPPRQPPDLRNRGQNDDDDNQQGGYPPQQPNQQGGYPPQQPNQQGGYPPQQPNQQGGYPPQQPNQQGGYPPQQRPNQQYPGTGQLGGGNRPQPLGSRETGNYDNPFESELRSSTPPKRLGQSSGIGNALHERRIEYLAWGSVVLILGLSIILLAIDTDTAESFLLIGAPIISGGILMFSAFLQRIVFNYPVSLITWGTSIFALAFGSTQLIALLTERDGTNHLTTQLLYFVGLLVVISGMVIILQVFRRPVN